MLESPVGAVEGEPVEPAPCSGPADEGPPTSGCGAGPECSAVALGAVAPEVSPELRSGHASITNTVAALPNPAHNRRVGHSEGRAGESLMAGREAAGV